MKRVLPIAILVFLAACSSGHSKATPATTTTGSSAPEPSTTAPAVSSSTTATAKSPTTNGSGAPATTVPGGSSSSNGSTSGSNNNSSVQITSFSYVGNSPVECNAPTTIELKWTTKGATAVEIDIDGGGAFTRYANGTHDEMLPLACDGNPHTYKLLATAPGVTADHSITIETTKI